jgi:hypothetical protein
MQDSGSRKQLWASPDVSLDIFPLNMILITVEGILFQQLSILSEDF